MTLEFISLAILFVFFLGACVFSFWPLVRVSSTSLEVNFSSEKNQKISRLMSERDNIYKNILEVRFDKAMKKLTEDDYSRLLNPLNEKALNVLRRLEALGVKEGDPIFDSKGRNGNLNEDENIRDRVEKEILGYRKSVADLEEKNISQNDDINEEKNSTVGSTFCSTCEHLCKIVDKFCSNCGSEIK